MATLLMVPEIATGDGEATLSSWAVPVGTPFKATATIAVVETAKATVEVEAEADGVFLKFLVAEGTAVRVGDAIALVGASDESVEDLGTLLTELGVTDGVVGIPAPGTNLPAAAEAPASRETQADIKQSVLAGAPGSAVDGAMSRIFASPLARRLARDAGLELADLIGTGPNGRINRDDVKAAQARRPSAGAGVTERAIQPPPLATVGAGQADVPHTRLRRAIARRLTESVTTAPQFTVSDAVTVDRLLELRAEINASTSIKVSVNDLIVKAVAHAHTVVPAMNVVWMPDAVRQFDSVDIAVAVSTPNGLVAPVIRGVDRLGVAAIAAVTKDLVARARQGRLQQADFGGGSVSVSNLGMYGTRSFTAIINPPQASILAVGAASPEAVVVNGSLSVATMLHLTVSVDHRPVDGATAAQWMRALIDVLENPLRLLV